MALACGMPCETQPGHSIWKACSTTTLPRRLSSVISSFVLTHWSSVQSGARSYAGAFIRIPHKVGAGDGCWGMGFASQHPPFKGSLDPSMLGLHLFWREQHAD